MSLFSDICRDAYADENDVSFDEENKTWTVLPAYGLNKPLTGVPSKDMALAICRAIQTAYDLGNASADYS